MKYNNILLSEQLFYLEQHQFIYYINILNDINIYFIYSYFFYIFLYILFFYF
jgi:hypothetical protein